MALMIECLTSSLCILQKAIYAAKIKLLSHGLVDAAMGVDDVFLQVTRRKETRRPSEVKKRFDKMQLDASGGESDDADEGQADQLQDILDQHIKRHLSAASGSKRDDFHDGVPYQMLKALKKSFMAEIQGKNCRTCGA